MPVYLIQKHASRSLHYDFRLEVGGALVSWAVPKGPSLNPKDRRLAVRVDNHELDYADFEGVIPAPEYGAGTVMIWDRGEYENVRKESGAVVPMERCVEDGRIEIDIRGEKLKGAWTLLRTRERDGRQQWLLIKKKDETADPDRDVLAEMPDSAATGRTLEQITEES